MHVRWLGVYYIGANNHLLANISCLPLRNLVQGYECRSVFPAGVGAGLTLERCSQLACLRDSCLVEDGVLRCLSGGGGTGRGREHCHGEPGSALSRGYAPDSARAEGSSIVDEPGEC